MTLQVPSVEHDSTPMVPRGSELAIIEVQKTIALNKTGSEKKETGDIAESTKLNVSTEKTTMMRVGEGEVVPGDSDGLLPAPSIWVASQVCLPASLSACWNICLIACLPTCLFYYFFWCNYRLI